MDVLLHCADEYVLDNLYSKILSTPAFSGNNTFFAPTTAEWTRDNDWRIVLSLSVLVTLGGWFFYLAAATFSYYFIFDHETMKHPKFLKNQVRLEIDCAVKAVPGFACEFSLFHFQSTCLLTSPPVSAHRALVLG